MSETLQIFGEQFTDVTGIKAYKPNGDVVTFMAGSTVKTGTITPAARANQISIDIGMDSINGFMIMPSSESPWKSNGRTMGGLIIFKSPAGYWKRIALNSNTAGSAALAPGLSTSTATNETISDGVLTVPNLNYAYETIEYRWWVW